MGMTTVLITHNAVIAEIADKVIKIKNGTVEEVILNDHPKNASEIVW
jgi:putative ABC transport system ATP-binding protein